MIQRFWSAPQNLVPSKWESLGKLSHGGTHEKATDRRRSGAITAEADRDLAKGLTVADVCRKHGIARNDLLPVAAAYDPAQVDSDRRCRELELEVDRLKRLVAELLLDKQMLQDVAKKVVGPNQHKVRRRPIPDRRRRWGRDCV